MSRKMLCSINMLSTIISVLIFTPFTMQQQQDAAFMKTFNSDSETCAQENSLTVERINELWAGKQFPNETNLKCYFSCLNIKLGVMDEAGDIKDDVMEKVAAEFYSLTLADKIGDVCDIAHVGDVCQTAFDAMQCILNIQNGQG